MSARDAVRRLNRYIASGDHMADYDVGRDYTPPNPSPQGGGGLGGYVGESPSPLRGSEGRGGGTAYTPGPFEPRRLDVETAARISFGHDPEPPQPSGFGLVEWCLIGSIVAAGVVGLWLGVA